jgi:hypothetical protein
MLVGAPPPQMAFMMQTNARASLSKKNLSSYTCTVYQVSEKINRRLQIMNVIFSKRVRITRLSATRMAC